VLYAIERTGHAAGALVHDVRVDQMCSRTLRYARADIDLKRQALSQVFPDALAPPRDGRLLINGAELVGWLRRM
jgi:hypothetical protein